MRIFVVAIVLMFGSTAYAFERNPYSDQYNDCISQNWASEYPACSTPPYANSAITDHFNDIFDHACVDHDRCYATHGESKSDCDTRFLANMVQACGALDTICHGAASVYAGAVAVGAQSAWDNAAGIREQCR
ncbi:MAG: hypothetical protein RIM72_08760 [Alphaproteobacteria bacterium]